MTSPRYLRARRAAAVSDALADTRVVFYRVTADGVIDVVRVLHRRMDIDRHL